MQKSLREYNKKRDFNKTSEPQGKTKRSANTLRFAVQHHMASRDHYDLRLEFGGALLSWAVPKGPSYNTADKRLAVHVEDHPLEYRNFEGTIPKGEYGGGVVMLWDEGFWEPLGNVAQGLRDGMLKFVLDGERLKGKWALIRLKPRNGEKQENWLWIKENDAYKKKTSGISRFKTSVRTGRTMAQIEKHLPGASAKNPFTKAEVQLAKPANAVPKTGKWLYEIKYDGYRILAYIENDSARLITRNQNDVTARFEKIAAALVTWAAGRALVLDGEMVITDDAGKTDFQALQNFMRSPNDKTLTYVVFDLLALNGEDWRPRELTARKQQLEHLMRDAPPSLYYSQHLTQSGAACFSAACRAGLEGIIGKRADSAYTGIRNGDWIKLKCENRQEFVIGGYTLSEKKTRGLSSLLLGVYKDGAFIYTGRAGTGFTETTTKELETQFAKAKQKTPPFTNAPKPRPNETVFWLKPVFVAEIKFAEWTHDGLLRQASFKGLRADKDPKKVKKET